MVALHPDERNQKLKYHIQTSGRSLHAQEIDFNDIRTTLHVALSQKKRGCPERIIRFLRGDAEGTIVDRYDRIDWEDAVEVYNAYMPSLIAVRKTMDPSL